MIRIHSQRVARVDSDRIIRPVGVAVAGSDTRAGRRGSFSIGPDRCSGDRGSGGVALAVEVSGFRVDRIPAEPVVVPTVGRSEIQVPTAANVAASTAAVERGGEGGRKELQGTCAPDVSTHGVAVSANPREEGDFVRGTELV